MSCRDIVSLIVFGLVWLLVYWREGVYCARWLRRGIIPVSKGAVVIHLAALAGIVLFSYAYFIEPYRLEVRHVDIATDRLVRAAFTLVQISDLHCDTKIINEKRMPAIINEIRPDIICFTGDALNTPAALPVFRQTLAALAAPLGKYAVRGNLDVQPFDIAGLFDGTGFVELDGRALTLSKDNERLVIAGLGPRNYRAAASFLKRLPHTDYTVLLFHYPGIHEELGVLPVDLFLAGHTHGGQVCLPFYGAVITQSPYGKKYEAGRYDLAGGKIFYVNKGLGMEGFPSPRIRLGARPEITVFHIHPEASARR